MIEAAAPPAEIVGRHKAVFTSPPVRVPANKHIDGPLLGNGDVGVVFSGPPERLRFHLSKNDFWKTKPGYPDGGPRPIGGIDLRIPELAGASYRVEVDLLTAELTGVFATPDLRMTLRAWVDANENLLIAEVVFDGPANLGVELWGCSGDGSIASVTREGRSISRRYDEPGLAWPCEASVAVREFDPAHGFVAAIASSFEHADPATEALRRVAEFDLEERESRREAHRCWWSQFWSESWIEIPDEVLARHYYGAQYLLASCGRNRDFPPGLWGNWVTTDTPAWAGDYHLNYNHQAPFWGLVSSNHLGIADCYDAPLLDYLEAGRRNAERFLQIRGIYYEVGIGPRGFCSALFQSDEKDPGTKRAAELEAGHQFWGQKSNALFGAVPMLLRWQHTLDRDYAKRVLPYLLEVANFWEDYLKFEDGRYVIYRDCYAEAGPWEGEGWEDLRNDFNPLISLGLLRLFFRTLFDIGSDFDSARRTKWRHILDHLSELPLVEQDGARIPCGAESGPSSRKIGVTRLTIQGTVWPASIVGETQLPEVFEMVRKGAEAWDERVWVHDGNAFDTVPPGAARLRIDPERILEMMRRKIAAHGLPNLLIEQAGGGIETCGGITAGLNEMLLQSYEGVLRLFPCWPCDQDAGFGNLRTWGAFLVSANLRGGKVRDVKVRSEKGIAGLLQNPWPEESVQLIRNGRSAELLEGPILEFATEPGEEILFKPSAR